MYKRIKTKYNTGFFRIVATIQGEKFESPLVYPGHKAERKRINIRRKKIVTKNTTIDLVRSLHFTKEEIYDPNKMDVEPFSFDAIIKEAEDALKKRR